MRSLDQRVDLYELEAFALQCALQRYLHDLMARSTMRPVPLAEAMSIKPVSRIVQRLQKMANGGWTRPARGGRRPVARARPLRLEVDELLQLNALHKAGELSALLPGHRDPLQVGLGKVHQRAQNLSELFAV